MKVFVTGGSGFIGSKLVESLVKSGHEVSYSFLSNELNLEGSTAFKIDLTDDTGVTELIKKINPKIIIHSAALTSVDLCEKDRSLADKINVKGTENIVNACKIVNGKIVFISSSFVFDGKKKLFFEDDEPNPVNYYGITKVRGEEIVKSSSLPYLILRTDQPYGWIKEGQKKNTVIRILEKLDNNEITKDITDWYNNPTFIDDFVRATLELIQRNLCGTYHLVGPDYINRYDWSLKIAEIFGKNKNLVQPIKSEELNLPTKRPNANLSNKKIQEETGIKFVGIELGLKKMLASKLISL